MAKKEIVDFTAQLKALKSGPPGRLYVLRGEEDYLRDRYLDALRAMCVPEGLDSFNYRRLSGAKLTMRELSEALEAMPFLGVRTLVEVRDFDVNRTKDYDGEVFVGLLADLPEWTTLVFVFAPSYAPDGRIAPVKALRKYGLDVEVTAQQQGPLIKWVAGHFAEEGKRCDAETAAHMLYVCGTLMNALLPEIVKVAAHAEGDAVRKSDIDAVAERQPDTVVFEMTDALGEGRFEPAMSMLADLLSKRDESVQQILYMIGEQMRRLYAAAVVPKGTAAKDYLTECFPELASRAFLIPKLTKAARNFSVKRLARAVSLCADCDFALRDTSGASETELLSELLLRLALDRNDA